MQFDIKAGNDIITGPQGQALMMILQELRLISQLLYFSQRGMTAKLALEFMRAEQAVDATVKFTQ
jgi:hypothetical protein